MNTSTVPHNTHALAYAQHLSSHSSGRRNLDGEQVVLSASSDTRQKHGEAPKVQQSATTVMQAAMCVWLRACVCEHNSTPTPLHIEENPGMCTDGRLQIIVK